MAQKIIQQKTGYAAVWLNTSRTANLFGHVFTYAYNTQISCYIGTNSLSLVLLRHPPGLTTFQGPLALPTDHKQVSVVHTLNARLVQRIAVMQETFDRKITVGNVDTKTITTAAFAPQAHSSLAWTMGEYQPHIVSSNRRRPTGRWFVFKTAMPIVGPILHPLSHNWECAYRHAWDA